MGRQAIVWAALGAALALGSASTAHAQFNMPNTRAPRLNNPAQNGPTVSPYLNLLRNSNSPGVNFYGLVRPQQQFQSGIQGLQQQNAALAAGLASSVGTDPAGLPTTGRVGVFMNYGGFFMNNSGAMAVRGQGVAPRPQAAPQPTPSRRPTGKR